MAIPVVKVCCIQSIEEAHQAVAAGAAGIGLVSEMPSGPGVIEDDRIRAISQAMTGIVETFLLTSRRDPSHIVRQHVHARTTTIQICDRLDAGAQASLRQALPEVRLVQVIHVVGQGSVHEAEEAALHVDALLLDSGQPSAEVPSLGGTGEVHDWETSAQIVARVGIPVYLAGGLNPGNVGEAIRTVLPHGVDVCSGLRPHGVLDVTILEAFMKAVASGGRDA